MLSFSTIQPGIRCVDGKRKRQRLFQKSRQFNDFRLQILEFFVNTFTSCQRRRKRNLRGKKKNQKFSLQMGGFRSVRRVEANRLHSRKDKLQQIKLCGAFDGHHHVFRLDLNDPRI